MSAQCLGGVQCDKRGPNISFPMFVFGQSVIHLVLAKYNVANGLILVYKKHFLRTVIIYTYFDPNYNLPVDKTIGCNV